MTEPSPPIDRLASELQRRFPAAPADSATVQTLILGFRQGADWPLLADFCQRIHEEFALPWPAISVAGEGGFHLWWSLAEPVDRRLAHAFLSRLIARILPELPAQHLELLPATYPEVPARHPASDRWSAFIDPGMGELFIDEGGLDIPPNRDRQAELLAGVEPIRPADLDRILALAAPAGSTAPTATLTTAAPWLSQTFDDPRRFLLAVMNDAALPVDLRIEAAKALLPHCPDSPR